MNALATKVITKLSHRRGGHCIYEVWRSHLTELLDALPAEDRESLVGPAVSFLESENSVERANSVYLLGELGTIAQPAVPGIIKAMNDQGVIEQALVAVPKIDPHRATLELSKSIATVPANLRHIIVDWLGELGEAAIPYLVPYLADAVDVLTKIGAEKIPAKIEPETIPAILGQVQLSNLSDKRGKAICAMAGNILSSFGSAAVPLVVAALESSTATSNPAIISMIASLPSAEPYLSAICRDFIDGKVDEQTLFRVWIDFGYQAAPYVCQCLPHASVSFYPQLYLILKMFGYSAIPLLKSSLSHQSKAVQAHTAVAILEITGADDRDAVEKLVSLLVDDDEQSGLTVVEALAFCGDRRKEVDAMPPVLAKALQSYAASSKISHVSTEVAQRIKVAMAQLGSAILSKDQAAQDSSYEYKNPVLLMPGYELLRETLEKLFPHGMVLGTLSFSAHQLKQPLSAQQIGQPTFLRKQILVEVRLDGYGFRPFGAFTFGVFAYDGATLTYLEGGEANKSIGETLRKEELDLYQVDPVELSWFFCHTLVPGARGAHVVVEPSGSQAESAVRSPSVTATAECGWIVHFWTLFRDQVGCRPSVPILCEHTVSVSRQFDISYKG